MGTGGGDASACGGFPVNGDPQAEQNLAVSRFAVPQRSQGRDDCAMLRSPIMREILPGSIYVLY
jgi:hypothetical protein